MRRTAAARPPRLPRSLAIVLAAGAAGALAGVALGVLTRGDEDPIAAGQATTGPARAPTPSVRIGSAVLFEAATERGRQRRQSRVVVDARVRNRAGRPLDPGRPRLLVGSRRIAVDPANRDAAADLLAPIAPDATASGTLRFELRGAATDRVTEQRRARLSIAGRVVTVRLTLSPTPARSA